LYAVPCRVRLRVDGLVLPSSHCSIPSGYYGFYTTTPPRLAHATALPGVGWILWFFVWVYADGRWTGVCYLRTWFMGRFPALATAFPNWAPYAMPDTGQPQRWVGRCLRAPPAACLLRDTAHYRLSWFPAVWNFGTTVFLYSFLLPLILSTRRHACLVNLPPTQAGRPCSRRGFVLGRWRDAWRATHSMAAVYYHLLRRGACSLLYRTGRGGAWTLSRWRTPSRPASASPERFQTALRNGLRGRAATVDGQTGVLTSKNTRL